MDAGSILVEKEIRRTEKGLPVVVRSVEKSSDGMYCTILAKLHANLPPMSRIIL